MIIATKDDRKKAKHPVAVGYWIIHRNLLLLGAS